jgi:hypothetical protein
LGQAGDGGAPELTKQPQEALNGKCKILIKERETWKHACAEMAKGIAPVLDVIGVDSTEAGVEAPKIGLVEKSQKA